MGDGSRHVKHPSSPCYHKHLSNGDGTALGFSPAKPKGAARTAVASFLRAGDLGMDTIIMGPGNIDQAHQPDEYMSIDVIEPCIDVLQKMISHQCL